jgi:hypothetical protein
VAVGVGLGVGVGVGGAEVGLGFGPGVRSRARVSVGSALAVASGLGLVLAATRATTGDVCRAQGWRSGGRLSRHVGRSPNGRSDRSRHNVAANAGELHASCVWGHEVAWHNHRLHDGCHRTAPATSSPRMLPKSNTTYHEATHHGHGSRPRSVRQILDVFSSPWPIAPALNPEASFAPDPTFTGSQTKLAEVDPDVSRGQLRVPTARLETAELADYAPTLSEAHTSRGGFTRFVDFSVRPLRPSAAAGSQRYEGRGPAGPRALAQLV